MEKKQKAVQLKIVILFIGVSMLGDLCFVSCIDNPVTTQSTDTLTLDTVITVTHVFQSLQMKYKTNPLKTIIKDTVTFGRKCRVFVPCSINVQGVLILREGVHMFFSQGAYITIDSGSLVISGSDSLPVVLKNRQPGTYWGYDSLNNPRSSFGILFTRRAKTFLSSIRYCTFDSVTTGITMRRTGVVLKDTVFLHPKYTSVVYDTTHMKKEL